MGPVCNPTKFRDVEQPQLITRWYESQMLMQTRPKKDRRYVHRPWQTIANFNFYYWWSAKSALKTRRFSAFCSLLGSMEWWQPLSGLIRDFSVEEPGVALMHWYVWVGLNNSQQPRMAFILCCVSAILICVAPFLPSLLLSKAFFLFSSGLSEITQQHQTMERLQAADLIWPKEAQVKYGDPGSSRCLTQFFRGHLSISLYCHLLTTELLHL